MLNSFKNFFKDDIKSPLKFYYREKFLTDEDVE